MFQFLVDALLRAVDLSLIALALSCVYSLIRFPNVALVQYATSGALIAVGLQAVGLPLAFAIIVACALVGLLALAMSVLIFEKLLRISPAIAMIGSLALSMIFTAAFLVTVGPRPQRFDLPIAPPLRWGGVSLTQVQMLSVGLTVLAIAAFALVLFRTGLGRCMRATATNRVLAEATGIPTRRVTNAVIVISGVMAALGGIAIALKGETSSQLGMDMLLPIFAAAILGGLGNALGAVLGAIIIALAETFVTNTNFGLLAGQDFYFLPASFASVASFGLLVLILLVRPVGILVSEVKRV
ncbi:branched-chain amino acid ABC transporter permease [Paenirhodobacter sp.]|uniref:branched-chain amino acid ABC transporter permease n=1 Tax=Paenirhodobacter sp. TaxID=1965326 RepID=UPI003B3CF76D